MFSSPKLRKQKRFKREVKLPGKDYKSPQSFPFGTPYVEIRDFLADQNEELFRRNSVLGLLERDATTKRAPERWQALDSEEVASFDVVVCFESRVFDLVVEGTFSFALTLKGCCAGFRVGFGSLLKSSCSRGCGGGCSGSNSSRSSSVGSSSSGSSNWSRCSSNSISGTINSSINSKSSSSSSGNNRKYSSSSSSVTLPADAVEVGGLGVVGVDATRPSVGIRLRRLRRHGLHIAGPWSRAPLYCRREGLRFATPKDLQKCSEDTRITTLLVPACIRNFVVVECSRCFRRADRHVQQLLTSLYRCPDAILARMLLSRRYTSFVGVARPRRGAATLLFFLVAMMRWVSNCSRGSKNIRIFPRN